MGKEGEDLSFSDIEKEAAKERAKRKTLLLKKFNELQILAMRDDATREQLDELQTLKERVLKIGRFS